MIKVSTSQKQFLLSLNIPKTNVGIILCTENYTNVRFFGRIDDTIICFWDCLTFKVVKNTEIISCANNRKKNSPTDIILPQYAPLFLRNDYLHKTFSFNWKCSFEKALEGNVLKVLQILKVGKSQNQFFLNLHCPKNERNITQNFALWS